MGSQKTDDSKPIFDDQAYDRESPVHEVHLDAFQIGRYPVTVAQFQKYLDDSGAEEAEQLPAGFEGRNQPGELGCWPRPC